MIAIFNVLSLGNLAEAGARSLLIAALVGLALALLRVRNVAAQKLAWTLVLIASLAMPFLNSWTRSHIAAIPAALQIDVARVSSLATFMRPATALPADTPAAPQQVTSSTAAFTEPTAAAIADPIPPDNHVEFAPPRASSTYPPSAHAVRKPMGMTAPKLAFTLYAAGAILLLFRLFIALVAAMRLWFSALAFTPPAPSGHSGLRIRTSKRIASPVTIGSGVLLPEIAEQWDMNKLRIVLAHESTHALQGDFYLQLCADLYTALFWFSPLGWWLRRKLCALNETLSDGAAVREAASHATYAQLLLEFAAAPRTIILGVAMARKASISARIERLLDESRFRQAFTASPIRKFVGGMLVPAAVFAIVALLQVSANASIQQAAPPPPAAVPQTPSISDQPAPVNPAPAVEAPAAPNEVPDAPPAAPQSPALSNTASLPPDPPHGTTSRIITMNENGNISHAENQSTGGRSLFSYSSQWGDTGEFYVLASKGWDNISCCGWMSSRRDELNKARAMAKGDFLWFAHDGKSYIVDDPQTVAELKKMYDPITELGRKQSELGAKQKALGDQQKNFVIEMRKEQRLEKPDVSKEIAELNAAVSELKTEKMPTISQEKFAEMQAKLAALQAKLAASEGEMGAHMGAIGEKQGKLGEIQGKLGAEQGRIGAEQGRLSREADHKVRSVIDQSLKNGKARPVQ